MPMKNARHALRPRSNRLEAGFSRGDSSAAEPQLATMSELLWSHDDGRKNAQDAQRGGRRFCAFCASWRPSDSGRILATFFSHRSPAVAVAVALVFALGFSAQEPAPKTAIDFAAIGRIKPRKAAEISASLLGIGCEVLDRDYTRYDAYKEYLGALGAKHARFQSGWAKTEKVKGVYDFTWLDHVIDDCRARGIQPWFNLGYGNPIYPGGGGITLRDDMPHGEAALQAWDAFIGRLVEHFKTRVFEWEVWNEANNLRGEHAGPALYGDLFIRTAETIKRVQPQARVIALAVGFYALDYTRAFFDHLKSKNKVHLVDVVSMHGYPMNPDDDRLDKFVALVQQYDPRIALLQGEAGSPSTAKTTGAMASANFSELTQAKWNLRRALVHLGRGIPHSQFAISDMMYPTGMNTKGLLKANDDLSIGWPKQSYYAYQYLTSVFDAAVAAAPAVAVELKAPEKASAYAFRDQPSGGLAIAYWHSGAVPAEAIATRKAGLVLPGAGLKEPVLIDLRVGAVYGVPASAIRTGGGRTEFTLPIYDSPLLLCERRLLASRGLLAE